MRTVTAIAVAVMLVLAGCSQAPGTDTTTGPNATTQGTQSTAAPGDGAAVVHPPDPDSDVLGWENGVWYNETINVTRSDGLNNSEMDAVVNRAMARVEKIRQLEFEKKVPVKVVSRSEFKKNQQSQKTPPKRRTFDNVKYEALMMVGESTDSIAVQNRNTGSSVGGYYSPRKESIVVISNNESAPKMDEITLSQELFHALQDQKYNLSTFDQRTREDHNAVDGIVEGDGNYVDHLYEQRCKNAWKGTCLLPQNEGNGGGGGDLANIGPYLLKFQPYSDGPPFVKSVRQKGGWQAVNDLYQNPPASTEQVIHPKKYGADAPADVSIRDTTSNGWQRLEPKGRPNYAKVGEAGIMSMFTYPTYESQGKTQIIPFNKFVNRKNGEPAKFDPLNYRSEPSAGWDGDRIAVYTNGRAAANETGYVFKTKWDSRKDARQFVDTYERLLQYRDAKKVDDRANTWEVPQKNGFSDAFYVQQKGDTVVIVNAPSVGDLSDVHAGAAPKQ